MGQPFSKVSSAVKNLIDLLDLAKENETRETTSVKSFVTRILSF
ncbi:hypothetical protein [Thermoanaerobacterium sp. DL9XJH110]